MMMTVKAQNSSGFSLLEMAILILIIGVMLVPMLTLYQGGKIRGQYTKVEQDLQDILEALNEFQGNNNVYPCPAARNTSPGDLNHGRPVCFPDPASPLPGECLNGVCRVLSQRDINGDGNPDNVTVLIGSIPYEVLNSGAGATVPPDLVLPAMVANQRSRLTANQMFDPWGRRYLYAVTESMVDPDTFLSNHGAVGIFDENGQNLSREPFSAHIVILSHGVNGAGGWTQVGTQFDLCSAGVVDEENCDLDAEFVSGLMNLGNTANYYDDFLVFSDFNSSSLWESSLTVSGAIYNTTLGNVGVGTMDPQHPLDLQEPLRANQIHTNEFCDPTGTLCYSPNLIAGDEPDMQCPPGQGMFGISNGLRECRPLSVPTVPDFSCPANTYLIGVSNLGTPRCCPMTPNGITCGP